MEGVELYAAATEAGTEWIVVKAICDWADGTKSKTKALQLWAACVASSYVHHVLRTRATLRGLGRCSNFLYCYIFRLRTLVRYHIRLVR